jgi:release factor glutamine methyltransferase
MKPSWTLLELIREASAYLAKKGVSSPRLDTELLMACVLGCSRVELYLRFDQPLTKQELDRFRELLRRRARREPLAYILGAKEFWSLSLRVSPSVLIPRPETETLVEVALEELKKAVRKESLPISALELGTGSGAIAIALARELGASVSWWATDISREALEVARWNARQLGVQGWIKFLQGDMWEALEPDQRRFRLVISNPPYIPTALIQQLEPEIRCYEPALALDGGHDGLALIRRIIEQAPCRLVPGGMLVMEVGEAQSELLDEILGKDSRWGKWGWRQDLGGRLRALWAVTREV